MAYNVKIDDNRRPITDGISSLVLRTIETAATGIVDVSVPQNAFGVVAKRCPINADISIDNSDYFPLDEGEAFTPFVDLQSIKLDIKEVGTSPILLLFMV